MLSFLLLGSILAVTVSTWRNPPLQRSTLERIVERKKDTTRHYEDEAGRTHGVTRVAEADPVSLRAIYPFMDSVLRTLDLQGKQLQVLTAASTKTEGTFRPKVESIVKGDKTVQRVSYKDKYLDLEGIVSDTPLFKYSIRDSLLFTTYTKKKWLLGRKETFIDAYSPNPASKIENLTGLRVSVEKPKRFGIGPYIGFGYNGQEWKPSVGLSLQYSIIKF